MAAAEVLFLNRGEGLREERASEGNSPCGVPTREPVRFSWLTAKLDWLATRERNHYMCCNIISFIWNCFLTSGGEQIRMQMEQTRSSITSTNDLTSWAEQFRVFPMSLIASVLVLGWSEWKIVERLKQVGYTETILVSSKCVHTMVENITNYGLIYLKPY